MSLFSRSETLQCTPQVTNVTCSPAKAVLQFGWIKRASLFRVLPFAAILAVVLMFQAIGGAYSNEFGGHPDESAHFMTGLMVRDYIAAHCPWPAMAFAEGYYLHYPKVALGHWPPVFYMVQAIWMLLLPPSRATAMLLMALVTTTTATMLYYTARRSLGSVAGVVSALVFVSLPLVQRQSGMLMADSFVGLTCFAAALCVGRFLERGRASDVVWFSVMAALAVLSKGNGVAVAVVPILGVVFVRRYRVLFTWRFWLPCLFAAAVCGVWYLYTFRMVQNGWGDTPGWAFTSKAIVGYASKLWAALGPVVLLMIAAGIGHHLLGPFRSRLVKGVWAASAALILGVFAVNCLVPATIEDRMIIPALPPLLLYAAAGGSWIYSNTRRLSWAQRLIVPVAAILAIGFLVKDFAPLAGSHRGFSAVAEALLSRTDFRGAVVLVSSEGNGDGQFISETAMREIRPGHVILRASKVLASSFWSGADYRSRFHSSEEVLRYLSDVPVSFLVIDAVPGGTRWAHHAQLLKMIADYPGRFELIGTYPQEIGAGRMPDGILVYRLLGTENSGARRIVVDMRPMVDKSFERTIFLSSPVPVLKAPKRLR